MNSVATGLVLIPGAVALLVCLVFTYLHEQSRQGYFRAWQLAWAAYTLHYAAEALEYFRGPSASLFFLSSVLLVGMTLCIFASTRLMREPFQLKWYDAALAVTGIGLAYANVRAHLVDGVFRQDAVPPPYYRLEVVLAAILLYCSLRFYFYSHRKNSLAFLLLAFSLALWALLFGADPRRLLAGHRLAPRVQNCREPVVAPLPTPRALIYIAEPLRVALPSVERGFSSEFLEKLQKTQAGDYIAELAYRRGGVVTFRNLAELEEPLPALSGGKFEACKQTLLEEGITDLMAVSLQTREHNFVVLLCTHAERRMFGSSNLRLLIGLALQIALTLENYVVMHEAQRRTKEYELLTEIGQAISSHLNQDEVLRTVHLELGQIFDTSNFYIAFQEEDEIHFELEIEGGMVLPKRLRKATNGLTEYIIRTGEPLLIETDLEQVRSKLGVDFVPPRPARSFCAVPIFLGGKPVGMMAALSTEQESQFLPRDLEVMQTVAGQLGGAVENARLFTEEQRRARHLAFLNSISKRAISTWRAGMRMRLRPRMF